MAIAETTTEVGQFAHEMREGFKEVDQRLEGIETRLEGLA